MNIIYEISELIQECMDEVLTLTVVGGYMIGIFTGVEVPIVAPAGILVYYHIRNN